MNAATADTVHAQQGKTVWWDETEEVECPSAAVVITEAQIPAAIEELFNGLY